MNTLLAVKQNAGDDLEELRRALAGHIREAAKIAKQIAVTETVQMFIAEADGEDGSKSGAGDSAKGAER